MHTVLEDCRVAPLLYSAIGLKGLGIVQIQGMRVSHLEKYIHRRISGSDLDKTLQAIHTLGQHFYSIWHQAV